MFPLIPPLKRHSNQEALRCQPAQSPGPKTADFSSFSLFTQMRRKIRQSKILRRPVFANTAAGSPYLP